MALGIGAPPRRINEIVLGKRRVTAETALRLARYFDTTPQFWLGLQAEYDLDLAVDFTVDMLKELDGLARELNIRWRICSSNRGPSHDDVAFVYL